MIEVVESYNGDNLFGTSPGATVRDLKLREGSSNSASNLAEAEEAIRQKYLAKISLLGACRC